MKYRLSEQEKIEAVKHYLDNKKLYIHWSVEFTANYYHVSAGSIRLWIRKYKDKL